jgi:hypothetical protein
MRSLMATGALALLFATGVAVAQTSTTQNEMRGKDTPAQETGKQPGAPNAPTSASDVRGGKGNPSPDQTGGPPEAGPSPLRGDGMDIPGATRQTAPAKFSQQNAKLAEYSIMGYPVQLDEKQRHAIWQALGKAGETKSADAKSITEEAGTFLPPLVQADEFPDGLSKEIPALRGLKYVKVDDKVLIVQPANGIVRGVIEE